jgi:hypothetical protein
MITITIPILANGLLFFLAAWSASLTVAALGAKLRLLPWRLPRQIALCGAFVLAAYIWIGWLLNVLINS